MPKRKNSFAAKPAKEARVDDTPINFSEFLDVATRVRVDDGSAANKQTYAQWMQETHIPLSSVMFAVNLLISDYQQRIAKLKRLLDKRTTELQKVRRDANQK